MKNKDNFGNANANQNKKYIQECDCDDCHDECDCDDCQDESNCDCCQDDECDCDKPHGHLHTKKTNRPKKPGVKMCVLEDGVPCTHCGACNMCDLDPTKICDNCGKCLDEYNTDDKGYVSVPIDKIIMGSDEETLEDFDHMYGLDDDD
jgi:hypothetical protein